jgi:hypothetical protein
MSSPDDDGLVVSIHRVFPDGRIGLSIELQNQTAPQERLCETLYRRGQVPV